MKVSELSGGNLDYWVARALGHKARLCLGEPCEVIDWNRPGTRAIDARFQPSSDWSHGGPIIEREHIMLAPGGDAGEWGAHIWLPPFRTWHFVEGPTPLIAAMRAYVALKFGEEVPDKAKEGAKS